MDEPTIPSSIADIDASWMAAAVGQPITGVNHEQIGEGVGVSSAVYRSTLEGGDLDSVVVKLPALAEEAVFTSTVLRMYIREVRFFENLAHQAIRVPAGYHGAVDLETSQFVQVMEDMGSMRMVDQNEGMNIDDAQRAVDDSPPGMRRSGARPTLRSTGATSCVSVTPSTRPYCRWSSPRAGRRSTTPWTSIP